MRTIETLIRLTRPSSTFLISLTVFLPLVVRLNDIELSFKAALPILLIAMCTFIVNDIDDIEADKINHPDRPLPSGSLVLSRAAGFYFACLASALFATKLLAPADAAPLYYVLLILVINYKYVVDYFPKCKPIYVATTSTLPVLVVAAIVKKNHEIYIVAIATAFFVLGREVIMDYLDSTGDPVSYVHYLSRNLLTAIICFSHLTGLALLSSLIDGKYDLSAFMLTAALTMWSIVSWLAADEGNAIRIMKAQLFCGLYFLIF